MKVLFTRGFQAEAKRLKKKYRSLTGELETLVKSLVIEPQQGTPIGFDCYKIRLHIHDKQKGKSGGARVITHVYFQGDILYLISIYDKSERSTITKAELKQILKTIREE